jgi:hypothetical protein
MSGWITLTPADFARTTRIAEVYEQWPAVQGANANFPSSTQDNHRLRALQGYWDLRERK